MKNVLLSLLFGALVSPSVGVACVYHNCVCGDGYETTARTSGRHSFTCDDACSSHGGVQSDTCGGGGNYSASSFLDKSVRFAPAERWACDCESVDKDGDAMVIETEGATEAEARLLCTTDDGFHFRGKVRECSGLGRGDQ